MKSASVWVISCHSSVRAKQTSGAVKKKTVIPKVVTSGTASASASDSEQWLEGMCDWRDEEPVPGLKSFKIKV